MFPNHCNIDIENTILKLYKARYNVVSNTHMMGQELAIQEYGIYDICLPRRVGKSKTIIQLANTANMVRPCFPSVLVVYSSTSQMNSHLPLLQNTAVLPSDTRGYSLFSSTWAVTQQRENIFNNNSRSYFDLVLYDEVEPDYDKFPSLVHFALRTPVR